MCHSTALAIRGCLTHAFIFAQGPASARRKLSERWPYVVDAQGISMILSSSYRRAYIPRDNVTRIYYNILAKSDITKEI